MAAGEAVGRRPLSRRLLVAVLGIAAWQGPLVAPAGAEAAPEPVMAELHWELGPGAELCMSGDRLAAATEALLGRSVFLDTGSAGAAIRIRGGITRAEPGPGEEAGSSTLEEPRWIARIQLETADGRRLGARELTSSARECRGIDESLPVIISLMVDVDRERLDLELARFSPPGRASEPPPVVAAEPAPPRVAPDSSDRWRLGAAAGAGLSYGALPGLPSVLLLAGTVRPPRMFQLEVAAVLSLPDGDAGAAPAIRAWSWKGGLHACPLERGREVVFQLCAGAEAGRFQARGVGVTSPRTASGTLLDGVVGVRIGMVLDRVWRVRLDLEAVVPAVRNEFVYTEVGNGQPAQVFEPALVAGRATLAVAFRSP